MELFACFSENEESAVFTLLMTLDRAYRKLRAEEAAQEATANPPAIAEGEPGGESS